MKQKNKVITILTLIIICVIFMAIVDGIIRPTYGIKSLIKIVLFLGSPIIYSFIDRDFSIKQLLTPNKKGFLASFCLGLAVYAVILGSYFLFRGVFDFSGITESLTENIGVTGNNFVFVAIYISFANSLLEEFFFRGFAFLTLKNLVGRKRAYVFSSVVFAMYHIWMMVGWFSIMVFLLAMIGLVAGAMIFNYLNEKNNNIYSSWMVHMFANFAINTIGFILFGII
ncbi:MAG: CPBP family intramembrane glutamic endopeptidase [Anaerovoracaceae bacterium]